MGLGACQLVVAFQAPQTTWTVDRGLLWKLACGSQICQKYKKMMWNRLGAPEGPFSWYLSLAHLCSWLPRDTDGALLLAPVSSLSMLIHSGETQRRQT